ncbi:FecR family protein [uncultured Kriegella sp.]|mgnify:CR=1 FL=1|uniref:FecR family protein n=1 Tax=uncultured Kriegella sp. TaxID=1798910 RepID=UPI0030DA6A0E|tara:strand:- start:50306 stop:51457 length:1152 start_codon:yes stop_codon:yes gene_type:complete
MIPEKIEKYIIKYLTKTATAEELEELEAWIEDPSNKKLFEAYVQHHYAVNMALNNSDSGPTKAYLTRKIRQNKPVLHRFNPQIFLKYAAVAILFIALGYLFFENSTKQQPEILIDPNQITLELDNGQIEVISENGQRKIIDSEGNEVGSQQGNQLSYKENDNQATPQYNQLNIPNGKQFELALSDGTMVTLNSGSSIKYPVQFAADQNREVTLSGEAYFKVAKDTNNPFIVSVNNLKVRVLGTEFNLSAYPEDREITTVLVEGLVGLYNHNTYDRQTATLIEPGFKGVYNESNDVFSVNEVDTNLYTSWKNGRFVFRHEQFKNIIKKLERNYNITIINNNQELGEQYYNASFDMEEDMEQIFTSFQKSYSFNYIIDQNTVTIN